MTPAARWVAALLVAAAAAWGVVATGRAPSSGDKTADRAAALDDARRRAVAETVGVVVNATVLVKNQLLVDDTVLTRAAGFVTNETITGEREAEGFYHVTISCDVEASLIATELDRLKRSVVVWVKDDGAGEIGMAVRQRLAAAGVECLDEAFLEGAGRKVTPDDAMALTPDALADVGRRYLARFIVYGDVGVRGAGAVPDEPLPYGVENPFAGYHICEAFGYVRAVDTGDGRVWAEWQLNPGQVRGFGLTEDIARENARANLGAALGDFFAKGLTAP